jgi:multiple sugar transport system substrate-binding protein
VVVQAAKCDQPGKLTFWLWDDVLAKIIEKSIEDWKTNYCPGAEVTIQVTPWAQFWTNLRTSAAGGNLPDVFWMSQVYAGFYLGNDLVLDLQPYWDKASVDTKAWGTGMVDPYRDAEGHLRAGPMNWDTIAVAYNKDLFDAAKVKYPTAEWTWDDYAKAAEAITNKDQGVYGAVGHLEFQIGIGNWIASAGEAPGISADRTKCSLTSDASKKALTFLKDLVDKGYAPKPSVIPSGTEAEALFLSGKVGMLNSGAWRIQDLLKQATFKWDYAPLPRNPETKLSRSIIHSVGYVAAKTTKNPDLAANLILYLASDAGQKFWSEGGSVAPANPNPELQKLWIDNFKATDKNIQAYVDATKDSQGITVFGEAWDTVNTEVQTNIFDLGMSVDEATTKACEVIDQKIAEQKSQ